MVRMLSVLDDWVRKDGYWVLKMVCKTEYKAVGVDGAPGAAGPAGGEGTPGENGKYYVLTKKLAVLIFIRMVNW